MFKSIFKTVVLITAVLLIGQVPLKGKVIGAHVQNAFDEAFGLLKREVERRKWLAGMPEPKLLSDWLSGRTVAPNLDRRVQTAIPRPKIIAEPKFERPAPNRVAVAPKQIFISENPPQHERFSVHDREAVKRLLED